MLKISVGQYSSAGRKEINQDFHGIYLPKAPQLGSKGIAIALADGISSSDVSQIASHTAVTSFLDDYYCTSDAWSVKTSAERVLTAANAWLYSQTQQSQYRYDKDRGYVCTLSALVIKSTTAHVFHIGDTRIYRLHGNTLELLTRDHRVWVSREQSYLARALGMNPQLEIDYQTLPVETGDVFLLATDGVYEHINDSAMVQLIHDSADDLDLAARNIVDRAYAQGSTDNLTLQIIRVDELPHQAADEIYQRFAELPLPPMLDARMHFDGYKIVREVHASHRSHIYLAVDEATQETVILKTPSIDLQADAAYLERFRMEEWVARRINSPHVLKPCLQTRKRNYVYVVTEFIDGQTLTQWMIDHPKPDLEVVRGIIEQIAKGLRAFHRMEMLHQDVRPDNVMIDGTGTVKVIDFGATRVASIAESAAPVSGSTQSHILGTVQYTAPEYFLGESGTSRSDLFSLGVIAYQMLTGRLPYGAAVARTTSRAAQLKLTYQSALSGRRDIPQWIDGVLRKAVHPDPSKRYEDVAEFVFDLRNPNTEYLKAIRPPLIERNPALFWKSVSLALAVIIILMAGLMPALK